NGKTFASTIVCFQSMWRERRAARLGHDDMLLSRERGTMKRQNKRDRQRDNSALREIWLHCA
ncbi:MAG: hypothetical protein ACODAQ_04735, partial [Phycisphaeraceae bacterium]